MVNSLLRKFDPVKSLLFATFLFCSILSAGQGRIKGRITDGQGGLPFATVALLGYDSTFIMGVVTNNGGEFFLENIRPGSYQISASMMGFTRYLSPIISIGNEQIDLDTIILRESSTQLNEVIIKENRQVIDQKIDRLVINPAGSITSSGNSVLDVLQKSPGVIVNKQNNTVALNGRSGVRVMINNKPMQVPLEVVIQMLDGMSAANLDKIELITTPPSKYDADGSGGIINLVTKRDEGLGTNGSLGLMAGAKWAESFGGNININHRNEKLAFFADYSVLTSRNLHYYKSETRSNSNGLPQRIGAYSHRDNFTIQQNASIGFEWNLDDKSSVNILLTGYRRNWNLDATTDDVNEIGMDSTVQTKMIVEEKNLWQSATASVAFQKKISARSAIGAGVDYLYYHNDNPSEYDNTALYLEGNIGEQSKIDLSKSTPIHFIIAKSDYRYDASDALTFESGIKTVVSTLDNDVLALQNEGDAWIVDPLFTSFSTLTEKIYAGYLSAKWQPIAAWQVNGGLRYEYTQTHISTPAERNLVDRRYGNLFPSLSVKRTLGPEMDINISYSKRITRPTYNDIAPYVFFWGPRTFSAGNTSLYPSIADAISAGYHFRQWVVSLQYSHARREIVIMQPEIDNGSNTITYRSENLKHMNTLALAGSYTAGVASWWELQANVNAQLQVARTAHLVKNISRRLYGISLNVTNQFRLPKNFSVEVSATYQSNTLSGLTQFLPSGSLNAGIQKNMGRAGVLRFSADDILNTNYWRLRTDSKAEFYSKWTYHWHNRFFRVTYTRTLGNSSLRSVSLKSGSEEERNRVGN